MNLKEKAKQLKQEIGTLYYAYQDPRTPLGAKILAIIVVSYALSPIDLIPDFIPVLGYLDDIILLPLGIFLAMKLIPQDVMDESRVKSREAFLKDKKSNYIMAGLIVLIWIGLITFVVSILMN